MNKAALLLAGPILAKYIFVDSQLHNVPNCMEFRHSDQFLAWVMAQVGISCMKGQRPFMQKPCMANVSKNILRYSHNSRSGTTTTSNYGTSNWCNHSDGALRRGFVFHKLLNVEQMVDNYGRMMRLSESGSCSNHLPSQCNFESSNSIATRTAPDTSCLAWCGQDPGQKTYMY